MKSKRTNPLFVSISIIVVSVFFIQSCTKTPTPGFTYGPTSNPEAGDSIMFTNASLDATTYSWDFGDGYNSTETDPMNIYVEAGAYTVTLTASNDKKSAMISEVVNINEATVMGVYVYEDDEETLITNCEVWVYDNLYDYENNYFEPHYEAYTDADGLALFLNLEDQEYIVDFYKATDTGFWGGAYYVGPLTLNEVNVYGVALEYTTDSKKSLERKIENRRTPKAASMIIE
jgi:hypothetical protein